MSAQPPDKKLGADWELADFRGQEWRGSERDSFANKIRDFYAEILKKDPKKAEVFFNGLDSFLNSMMNHEYWSTDDRQKGKSREYALFRQISYWSVVDEDRDRDLSKSFSGSVYVKNWMHAVTHNNDIRERDFYDKNRKIWRIISNAKDSCAHLLEYNPMLASYYMQQLAKYAEKLGWSDAPRDKFYRYSSYMNNVFNFLQKQNSSKWSEIENLIQRLDETVSNDPIVEISIRPRPAARPSTARSHSASRPTTAISHSFASHSSADQKYPTEQQQLAKSVSFQNLQKTTNTANTDDWKTTRFATSTVNEATKFLSEADEPQAKYFLKLLKAHMKINGVDPKTTVRYGKHHTPTYNTFSFFDSKEQTPFLVKFMEQAKSYKPQHDKGDTKQSKDSDHEREGAKTPRGRGKK